ncbi:MAG: tyrosine-type recombinase/integrase [Candidatus Norongarragalinales archaeon]
MTKGQGIYDQNKQLGWALKRTERKLSVQNQKVVKEFHDHCFSEGLSTVRIVGYVNRLNKLGEFLGKDFQDSSKQDIENLMGRINQANYSECSKQAFKVALKKFFKWLRKTEEYPEEVKWLKTGIKNSKKKLPEDLLTPAEIRKLIDTAQNPRDKAFISVLYESGCRISEIGTLEIRNVTFDKQGVVLMVSGKTGDRRVRLIQSTDLLRIWLSCHPGKTSAHNPLWCSLSNSCKGKPVKYVAFRRILDQTAQKSGLNTKKVNPHSFRHARASELANHLTEAQMKEYFGWMQGSDMAATYVHQVLCLRDEKEVQVQVLENAGRNSHESNTQAHNRGTRQDLAFS